MSPSEAPEGVQARFFYRNGLRNNEVDLATWREFLPAALSQGKYKVVSEPCFMGHGLESTQSALDSLGVALKKPVVMLYADGFFTKLQT